MVSLCGHGSVAVDGQPLFCPADAKPEDPKTMLPLDDIVRAAAATGATALFLYDAGRQVPDPMPEPRKGEPGKRAPLPANAAVLFSCGNGEMSHQSDKAGGGHGLFTFAVLKTLRGETGLNGGVSWTELVGGVEKAFGSPEFKSLLPAGRTQRPVLASGEVGEVPLLTGRGGNKH